MDLQVGVKIIIYDGAGNIFLIKRSSKKYGKIANQWDPVGGRIEAGTPLLENLKREIKEELGISLKIKAPTLIAAQDIIRKDYHVVRLTYKGITDGLKKKIKLNDEIVDHRWFSIRELEQLPNNELDEFVRKLLNKGLLF